MAPVQSMYLMNVFDSRALNNALDETALRKVHGLVLSAHCIVKKLLSMIMIIAT